MHVTSLTVTDFRNIAFAVIEPDPTGTTVITGRNGSGKTSLLEAVGYLATLQSFRGSPRDAMVRTGAESAIARAACVVEGRTIDIEAELSRSGRSRTLVNRQSVRRRADLHDSLRVTVFSPEDIAVVRAGPGERRRFLDDTLAVVEPRTVSLGEELEKILRQRAALLRQSSGRPSPEIEATLEVWDARLVAAGTPLVEAREALTHQLTPLVAEHYTRLADREVCVGLGYRRSWDGALGEALGAARREDLARGVTSVGPHRDELELTLSGLACRAHASQGEQRSLALALRLSAHQLATERLGTSPVLLLDDVFSELDPFRSRALLAGLPPGQALLTTAVPPPEEMAATVTYAVESDGRVGHVDHVPFPGPGGR
jgi:DNA replication and repair protein RecF